MTPLLLVEGYGPINFTPALPKNWKGKVLPGSLSFYYEGDLGWILIQEYRSELWCIRYIVLRLLQKTVLQRKEEDFLRLQFIFKGDLKYRAGTEKIKIAGGSVNAIWAPGRNSFGSFLKNTEYVLFQVLYSPGLVQQLLPEFPKKSILPERKFNLIEGEWSEAIQKILEAPYDEEMLHFFYENRIRDILWFFLLRPGGGIRYEGVTDEDVAKVRQVDALILSDLKKWLSIPVLAKKVNMTEFKLKWAFKQVIGLNLFERLREARLHRAKQLLLETDLQIKVIFREVGYKSLSGFEDAFKEKYGLSPLQYRKTFQPRG
jgi:AraC-like DNA-binding protein